MVSGPLENASEPPTNYLIIEGREEYLQQPVEGYIHRVPASDFRRVYGPGGGASNEWVCPYPVPIDRAGPVEHIKSIDQIFCGWSPDFLCKRQGKFRDHFPQPRRLVEDR